MTDFVIGIGEGWLKVLLMNKVAQIVSVGGSPQPILTSLRRLQADRVVFFCSPQTRKMVDGSGRPCEVREKNEVVEKLPSLVEQMSLQPDSFVVLEATDADDLGECYTLLTAEIERQLSQGYKCVGDYTGGSKTMASAVAMAITDYGQLLYLTTGIRKDAIKVTRGQDTELVSSASLQISRLVRHELRDILSHHNYAAAVHRLGETLINTSMPRAQQKELKTLSGFCKALDHWDRFDHAKASDFLYDLQRFKEIRKLNEFLQRICSSRGTVDEGFESTRQAKKLTGYEVLEDLLLNAQRRADQRRYDDAVGRLYRALELFAQLRLRSEYGIRTGAVEPEQVPEGFRAQLDFSDGPAKVGLDKSFRLLAAFPEDPLGAHFTKHQGAIKNALQTRNFSILAHGFQPVDAQAWASFEPVIAGFILEGLRALLGQDYKLPPQLPTTIPDEILSILGKA